MSRVSCFHQPCLLLGRTSRTGGACRFPVPRGGHLRWLPPLRLAGGFCKPTRRYHGRMSIHPSPLHVPPASLGVCTHAGSGSSSRVRRRLLTACLGDPHLPGHGPDWHLGSKVVSGGWLSLITCGDVYSDTLETHGF